MGPDRPGYGEQTSLALRHLPVRGRLVQDVPAFVRAYALVKAACASANVELGVLDPVRGEAIERAARSVAALDHLDLFPIPVVQGGGGTSSNMNINEAIASLATVLLREANGSHQPGAIDVHPNDHVNASQSTNDTYPTAMSLTLMEIGRGAVAALAVLEQTLLDQARRGRDIKRLGRTCLQDAVSLTVEDTHRAQAAIVSQCLAALETRLSDLREVPLGGTVLGTGIGAPEGFGEVAVRRLSALAERDLVPARNRHAAMAHLWAYASLADSCKQVGVVLARIATDLRLLSAGPVGGPGEVSLPALQAGSSIMPGKVNPVVPELVMQLSFRVRGAAHTVDLAAAAGELELNVMEPVVLDALVTCLEDIEAGSAVLAEKCVRGMTWNREAVDRSLAGALDEYVDLARAIGYGPAAQLAAQRARPVAATTNDVSGTAINQESTLRSNHDG